MHLIIDAHQDLAYNILSYGRDYRRSAAETRQIEKDIDALKINGGDTLLGWPDYQRGQVGLVFSTLFVAPKKKDAPNKERLAYADFEQAHQLYRQQAEQYRRLVESDPDKFRLVLSGCDLREVLTAWEETPAAYPETTHPVGLVMLMEGAEGVRQPAELEEWRSLGVRIIGLAWLTTRFCSGMDQSGPVTAEGWALLEAMADLGFTLDISHMCEKSALQALDGFGGAVIASHANVRALLKGMPGERHLTDDVIRLLLERDGVIGVIPFNRFLQPGWNHTNASARLPLAMLADHIDYICQMAGDARHVGIGSDFDGGFGRQMAPAEIDTVADLQKLAPILEGRGYQPQDITNILSGNWRRFLERTLPES